MRFGTGLSRGEFTLLARCRATGRTTDREYLLWGEGLFHGEKIVPKNHRTGTVSLARSQTGQHRRFPAPPCVRPNSKLVFHLAQF